VSGTNLFAGTGSSGVFLSTTNGASWSAVNAGLTDRNGNARTVYALAVGGTNLFAGTSGGGVFLSTNNGASWSPVNTGLTKSYVNALAASGTNLFAGTDGGGIFLSTNDGASWSAVNTGLTNTAIWSLAVSGTYLFAGTRGGVFLSTNGGASWSAVNTGLTNIYVTAFAVSGTNLFAGTYGTGVWRRRLSEMVTSVQPSAGEPPVAFKLEQNYPNPFNPGTTIKFSVVKSGLVSLKVYDLPGREVATLVNEEMNPGSYEVSFDATRLASGVYFYRLCTGEFVQTKTLVLQK